MSATIRDEKKSLLTPAPKSKKNDYESNHSDYISALTE